MVITYREASVKVIQDIRHQSTPDGGCIMNILFFPLLFLSAFLLLLPGPSISLASESIEIISPSENVFAGQPLLFELNIKGIPLVDQVAILYRPMGIRRYRKIHLLAKSKRIFSASLKS